MPPRKSKTPQRAQAASFKIKLGGAGEIWTIADLRAMLHEAVNHLEADGITHVRPSNLYINPVDAKGQPIVRVRGQPLEDLLIAHPYRSGADEHGV